ncbi:MAG: HlyD family efflux transporter periplasmic adaptor subunit [Candidatus Thiosymbion ectosymbiont of Robbea hypermnestra]|nr:HlyD family efflux transporter periplasmic adaptor subunit [Candidatus Thiosymbion ectosymbiont of Robbea hypermnestra]
MAIMFGPPVVDVEIAKVGMGPLQVMATSEGKTRVKDLYEIAAPIQGRLLRVSFKAGDIIKQEQTLAVLEPIAPEFLTARSLAEAKAKAQAAQAACDLAKEDIKRCEAEVEYADAELRRIKVLKETGANTQHALDEAKKNLRTKKAELAVAKMKFREEQHNLEVARAGLIHPNSSVESSTVSTIQIKSPINGRILEVERESETIVSPGQVIMRVGDPRTIEVELEMLSDDAARVNIGAEVRIEAWGGPILKGRVYRIEPLGYTKVSSLGIEEQRVRVLVDFEGSDKSWEKLGHGYGLDAHVVVWENPSVLLVPMGALFRKRNKWTTYVVKEGRAYLTPVEIGHTTTYHAEVISDLSKGDKVILYPNDQIVDGARVRSRD